MGRNMCKSQNLCKGAIVILIWNGFSALATVYDSDGSSTNVQYIHDTLAQDGDMITLPAGTFLWASRVNITKGITIQGETTTDTINRTANDQTIIVDNLPRVPGGQGFFHASTNSYVRITGITFSGQGGIQTVKFNGALRFSGVTHRPVRVDHCHIRHLVHSPAIGVWGNANGVADHNVADDYTGQFFFCQVFGEGWGGQSMG